MRSILSRFGKWIVKIVTDDYSDGEIPDTWFGGRL